MNNKCNTFFIPGNPGTPGVPGSNIITHAGNPNNNMGFNNDLYINTDNNYYFKKHNGKWIFKGNLTGRTLNSSILLNEPGLFTGTFPEGLSSANISIMGAGGGGAGGITKGQYYTLSGALLEDGIPGGGGGSGGLLCFTLDKPQGDYIAYIGKGGTGGLGGTNVSLQGGNDGENSHFEYNNEKKIACGGTGGNAENGGYGGNIGTYSYIGDNIHFKTGGTGAPGGLGFRGGKGIGGGGGGGSYYNHRSVLSGVGGTGDNIGKSHGGNGGGGAGYFQSYNIGPTGFYPSAFGGGYGSGRGFPSTISIASGGGGAGPNGGDGGNLLIPPTSGSYGGGGGGSGASFTVANNGGNGGNGYVHIELFY